MLNKNVTNFRITHMLLKPNIIFEKLHRKDF